MPLQLRQELAYRSVVRDWIRYGHNRLEPEHTLFVAVHDRSLIGPLTAGVLHIVEALAVRLPDIDLDALYGLASRILDVADD